MKAVAERFVEDFLKSISSPATQRAYRSDLRAWRRLLDTEALHQCSIKDLEEAMKDDSFVVLAASTQKRRLAVLKKYRRWVSEKTEKFLPDLSMPISTGRHISGRSSIISRPLTKQECRRLLNCAINGEPDKAVRNHAMIFFMLTVPMRRSAMARIDVNDLHLDEAVPFVSCSKTRGDLPLRYTLPPDTISILHRYMKHYDISSGPLWRSHSRRNPGGRLTPTSIYRIVRETALKAGLPDIGAHTLRHTGCTLAIDNGASLQQVQTHARHKQIETTMVYVHQRDRLRDSAADFIKVDEGKDA